MFREILVLAAIQLGVAWGCYALARHWGAVGCAVAAFFGLLGFFICCTGFMPGFVALQFLLLTVLGLGCLAWKTKATTFLASGAAGSLLVLSALGGWSMYQWSALRAKYPIESLADRLAYEARHAKPANTQMAGDLDASDNAAIQPAATLPEERLTELDQSYGRMSAWSRGYNGNTRNLALRLVHASHVEQFVKSDGFGVMRMRSPLPEDIEYARMPELVPIPAGVAPATSAEHERDRDPLPVEPLASPPRSEIQNVHRDSLADFANPNGFGYVESRGRVAGFLPHAFSQLPAVVHPQWTVHKVELVSLLKHERPMVYVSANLPNMSELGNVPVRAMDTFEQRGLTALLSGENVQIDEAATRIRMVGSIRAAKQCLECHSVDHGALLGAFSYELRPCIPVEAPAVQQEPAEPPF